MFNRQTEKSVRFHTLSGVLEGKVRSDGTIDMDFPQKIATSYEGDVEGLLKALGVKDVIFIGKNGMDFLIEIPYSESCISKLKPNFQVLNIQLKSSPFRN